MKIKVEHRKATASVSHGQEILHGLESDYPAFYIERAFSDCFSEIIEMDSEEFREWMVENIHGEFAPNYSLDHFSTIIGWASDEGYESCVFHRLTVLEGNPNEVSEFILDCLKDCESLQRVLDRERRDAEDERETLNSYLYDM